MSSELARRVGHEDIAPRTIAEVITGALDGLKAVRTFIEAEFRNRIDFGTIPGCGDKPTLFLPGAQKATMYFNAFPTYKVKQTELGAGHVEFRVKCLLVSRVSGQQIGEGLGCASTREKKFQRAGGGAMKKCPTCGKTAVIKGKEEYGGGWLCFAKKGGCGAKFADKHPAMAGPAEEDKDAPFEVRNTVLKMAKKRAHVDSAMTLGCLSEMFTQDIEDTFRMVEVRAAAQPEEEPEPYHVNGEVVEPPTPSRQPSAPGLFSNEHKRKTAEFVAWLKKKCDATNKKWQEEWEFRAARWMEDGLEAPSKIEDVINPWQSKGHLLKWAVDAERIDPAIIPEDLKPAQSEAYLALIYFASAEDRDALVAEMRAYVERQRSLKEAALYRKHPDLAPEGFFEEQAEAHGDAYEPSDEDHHAVAEVGGTT